MSRIDKDVQDLFQADRDLVQHTTHNLQQTHAFLNKLVVWVTGAAMILLAAAAAVLVANVTRRLRTLTATMTAIAGGNLEISVPSQKDGDEIGAMARALDIFKTNALETRCLNEERAAAQRPNSHELTSCKTPAVRSKHRRRES